MANSKLKIRRVFVGLKLCDDDTVDSAENVFCMICHKSFAYHGSNTSLVYRLQYAHPIHHNYEICEKLTKIND